MNIGLMGRAGSGKDTAGKWLAHERGYERVAFADPLRDAALALDPIVHVDPAIPHCPTRLTTLVTRLGWEGAKRFSPEVRRVLQQMGQGVRTLDRDFWLRQALAKVAAANEAGRPVVVTDVRYPNEMTSLRRAGFHMVRIERPDAELAPWSDHESERSLTALDADHVVMNVGDVDELHAKIATTWQSVHEVESAREYARSHS